jgi:hypothetical protein
VARLTGLGSLLVTIAVVLGGLRVAHVATPMFFPRTNPGPIVLDDPSDARDVLGRRPWVPSYRPRSLGESPPTAVVVRLPHPQLRLEWAGEHRLTVTETRGGDPGRPADDARPMPDVEGAWLAREGDATVVTLERDGLRIRIVTDLPLSDVDRLVRSLRPA